MLPILIDENFDHRIIRGLRLRLSHFDFLIVQQIGMSGVDDPTLLDWAAKEGRVIVTHDVNTVTTHANDRLKRGLPMPGVIIVPEQLEVGRAIDDLEIFIECSSLADAENQIQYLPL